MRKWINFLMTFLVGSTAYVNAATGDVNVFAGYRQDSVNWHHKVPKCDPFFKQSTKFQDIDIFQIGGNFRTTLGCNFYARGSLSGGWILNGDLKRKFSFYPRGGSSYSNGFDTVLENKHETTFDDNYVYDADIAIGYPFFFCNCTTMIAPVIGYAVNVQDFGLYERSLGIFDDGCGSECIGFGDCCKRTIFERWYGAFVGVDFSYKPFNSCWNVYAAAEFHWGRVKVKDGDHDRGFDDFNRRADMDGWNVTVGADYEFCECWTVGLNLNFKRYDASRNSDHCDCSDSYESGVHHKARNSINWNSWAVNLELGREF